jgi:hypothetical protein
MKITLNQVKKYDINSAWFVSSEWFVEEKLSLFLIGGEA